MDQAKRKLKTQEPKAESDMKYKCEKCARTYKQKRTLYTHVKYECDVTPQFTCNFCSKPFKRKQNLWRHTDLLHQKTNLKTLKERRNCNKCSRSYSTKSALNRHKRIQHEGITRQFICNDCDYRTTDKVNLYRHITLYHI